MQQLWASLPNGLVLSDKPNLLLLSGHVDTYGWHHFFFTLQCKERISPSSSGKSPVEPGRLLYFFSLSWLLQPTSYFEQDRPHAEMVE